MYFWFQLKERIIWLIRKVLFWSNFPFYIYVNWVFSFLPLNEDKKRLFRNNRLLSPLDDECVHLVDYKLSHDNPRKTILTLFCCSFAWPFNSKANMAMTFFYCQQPLVRCFLFLYPFYILLVHRRMCGYSICTYWNRSWMYISNVSVCVSEII